MKNGSCETLHASDVVLRRERIAAAPRHLGAAGLQRLDESLTVPPCADQQFRFCTLGMPGELEVGLFYMLSGKQFAHPGQIFPDSPVVL